MRGGSSKTRIETSLQIIGLRPEIRMRGGSSKTRIETNQVLDNLFLLHYV